MLTRRQSGYFPTSLHCREVMKRSETDKIPESGINNKRNRVDIAAVEGCKKEEKPGLINSEEQPLESWPTYLRDLFKLYESLNTIYTFLSARKHIIVTFKIVSTAVEKATGRVLTVEDIALFKYLLPDDISFTYVDKTRIVLESDIKNTSNKTNWKARATDQDLDLYDLRNQEEESNFLLIFEFVDGVLKVDKLAMQAAYQGPQGRYIMKVPEHSLDSMKELIEKRNRKFVCVINNLLDRYESDINGLTLKEEFEKASAFYIPVMPMSSKYTDPVELMSEEKSHKTKTHDSTNGRQSIETIISEIQKSSDYKSQIVVNGYIEIPEQEAYYGELNFKLSQNLINALVKSKGISGFYSHQAESINAINEGKNVIISSSTSSGKSLIYQVPVIYSLERDRSTKAMYIFPTKALAQDQKRALIELISILDPSSGLTDILVETYDGDTPMELRQNIRNNASVIFTNPDMLHVGLLPSHSEWGYFLQNLAYIVVDELHIYNGVFGSNVALIMRRLRRLCALYGNTFVQFISCSATIKNPRDHMKNIFGVEDVVLVDNDGSPMGKKLFLAWKTPFISPNDPKSGRSSVINEAAKLLVDLVKRNVKTIIFCKVRTTCELVIKQVRMLFEQMSLGDLASRVMSYRGGYSPQDRRKIEKEMFTGALIGVVATNALELGIDIGSLDAVIIAGFPYSVSNVRQQSGRAGRKNQDSLTVLIGSGNAVDQHFMENPEEVFTKDLSELVVDLDNHLILEGHIQCAAYELPIIIERDQIYFGPGLKSMADERLAYDKNQSHYLCNSRFEPNPAKFVNIRGIIEPQYAVIDITNDRNVVIEEIEESRTNFTLYEGGIFIHQGYPYLVKSFDVKERYAKVKRVYVDWTTRQRDFTNIDPIQIRSLKPIGNTSNYVYYGDIEITSCVFGFFKVDKRNQIIDAISVDNPPIISESKGFWIDIPLKAIKILREKNLNIPGAIHAAEHAVLNFLPSVVYSEVGDVRCECKAPEKELLKQESQRKRPARLVFYDSKRGLQGTGLSSKAFEFIEELMIDALNRIRSCECKFGCLECISSTQCSEDCLVISKSGARVLLECVLGEDININEIPMGPEENLRGFKCPKDTIIPVIGRVALANDCIITRTETKTPQKEKTEAIKQGDYF
ncbi:putative DEAD/DEAH box helicase [Nadsonia fulvescens var. elongata DSM 6958]|uniref:Putative DEAD/DEAH box helicase n=1 Tax=Nadsonia fulvescens var. elongata DSM 6958 TaxID=857566 RepID=A0A1E3PE82_9ASCO|nr:putative DEAD/DEAH box helicase [Nadsonia fulvescens var. elongata DSM 6958]